MENMLIFGICLYLIGTNKFVKLHMDSFGISLILKRTEYEHTSEGITENKLMKVINITKF